MTGEQLRAAIARACPLVNPRLSEVDWADVALAASAPDEGPKSAWQQFDEEWRAEHAASAPDEGPTPEGVTWHAECNHYCARPAAPAALDVEALRAALEQAEGHQPVGVQLHDGTYDPDDKECGVCAEDWPCLVSRLSAALAASATA